VTAKLKKAKALIYEAIDEILSGGCKVQISLHLEKVLEYLSEVEQESSKNNPQSQDPD